MKDLFQAKMRKKYIILGLLIIAFLLVTTRMSPFGRSIRLDDMYMIKTLSESGTLLSNFEIVRPWLRVIPVISVKTIYSIFGMNFFALYTSYALYLGIFGVVVYLYFKEETERKTALITALLSLVIPGIIAAAWHDEVFLLGGIFIFSGLLFLRRVSKIEEINKKTLLFSLLSIVAFTAATFTGRVTRSFLLIILLVYSAFIFKKKTRNKWQWWIIVPSFLLAFFSLYLTPYRFDPSQSLLPKLLNPTLSQKILSDLVYMGLHNSTQILFSIFTGGVLILLTYSLLLLFQKKHKKIVGTTVLALFVSLMLTPVLFVSTEFLSIVFFSQSYTIWVLNFLLIFSLGVIFFKGSEREKLFSGFILTPLIALIFLSVYSNADLFHTSIRTFLSVLPFLVFLVLRSFKQVFSEINENKKITRFLFLVIFVVAISSYLFHNIAYVTTFSQQKKARSTVLFESKKFLSQLGENKSIYSILPNFGGGILKRDLALLSNKKIENVPRILRDPGNDLRNFDYLFVVGKEPLNQGNDDYNLKENFQWTRNIPFDFTKDLGIIEGNREIFYEKQRFEGVGRKDVIYQVNRSYLYITPWIIDLPSRTLRGISPVMEYRYYSKIYNITGIRQ